MKTKRMAFTLLLLISAAVFRLPAQQSEADRNTLAEIRAKAEKGDAQAQFELGKLLLGADQDEAKKWLLKAAEQNHNNACFYVGLLFLEANSPAYNQSRAFEFFLRGAKLGNSGCAYFAGVAYIKGQGTPTNISAGIRWIQKSADQGYLTAQLDLADRYYEGNAVSKNLTNALHYYKFAAEQNLDRAQYRLGFLYYLGRGGVRTNYAEAAKWYRKAAEQGNVQAQSGLGYCFLNGQGVERDYNEAAKWFRKAAMQGDDEAQYRVGLLYTVGAGVMQDFVEAYKWLNLAAASPDEFVEFRKEMSFPSTGEEAKTARDQLTKRMTSAQIAEGQRRSAAFKPQEGDEQVQSNSSPDSITDSQPTASGTGFFITEDGYLITNEHVAGKGAQVRLVTSAGFISARVVKVDAANDLALLKAEGKFAALPVVASRAVKLGHTVATVGFPNIGLQGFSPKLTKGEISSLSGIQDDSRYFQISVAVQPGNSGGALVDERGNVVGVVSAKLSARSALAASGALPENVNYAVKSSFLLGFLESVPEVSAKLKEANTKEKKFENVVKDAEQAAVLVLVY